MPLKQKSKWELIKEFVTICKDNNIWYSLDSHSLLGLKLYQNFVPWVNQMQVLMTVFSYEKLAKLFPEKTLDSSKDYNLKTYKAFFLDQPKKWRNNSNFIEIRIIVPTNIKKVYKFNSKLKNLFQKHFDVKLAINKLYEKNYEGFYILDYHKKPFLLWIPNLSFEVQKGNFGEFKVNYLKENEQVLTKWFGKDYSKTKHPQKYYINLNPLEKRLVEK